MQDTCVGPANDYLLWEETLSRTAGGREKDLGNPSALVELQAFNMENSQSGANREDFTSALTLFKK